MTLLQEIEDGASGDMPLSTLLRKCLVLASRLGSKPATDWIQWELDGYPKDADVPDYRKLSVLIKVNMMDMVRKADGWTVPPEFLGEEAGAWTNNDCRIGIGQVEHLLQGDHSTVSLTMGNLMVFLMSKKITTMNITAAWGEVGTNQYKNILDTVRTRVLQFVLDLGKAYPDAGTQKPTPPKEAERANQIFYNIIHGSANVVGTASHSNVVVNVVQGDFASLKQTLLDHDVSSTDIKELKTALDAEPKPSASGFGPRVAGWIGAMVKKAAEGSWKIATGAAASLLSKALEKYYGLS